MSIAKKLIRGLKDVSPFFVSGAPTEELKITSTQPSEPAAIFQDETIELLNTISCFTIFPQPSFSGLLSDSLFVEALRKSYGELYVLTSLLTQQNGFSPNSAKFPRKLTLTSFQVEDLLHPEQKTVTKTANNLEGKSQCFFMDPKLLMQHPNLFQMLDRVILNVSAKAPESMILAYQTLGACIQKNPHARFLLFVEDAASDEVLEMVCERFAEIASRFQGIEIDFLGFSSGSDIRINKGILQTAGAFDEILKEPIKLRLNELFAGELVAE